MGPQTPDAAGSPLPYTDTKPQGAPDFYYVINATFTHIRDRFGVEALRRYWRDLGRDYQRPVWEGWRAGGLPAVARYWRAFFDAEPGGDVVVTEHHDRVVLDVRVCPAIAHLRAGGRPVLENFCEHCSVMGGAAAEQAGLGVRVEGGGGSCRQTFAATGQER